MKRKIFSKLLMVALVIAAVGSFVSCKDYDDDINNLQKQIDAKAALSELTALQSTLDSKIAAAQTAATAAQAKADAAATKTSVDELKKALETAIADAKKAGTDAGTQAGTAIAAANKAQETADAAAQAAKDADAAAKKALEDALKAIEETYQTKAAAAEAAAEAAEALAAVKATADAAYTKAEAEKLQEQVNNLKADLESQIEEKVKEAIKSVGKATASVAAIWSAVTSVEFFASEYIWNSDYLNFQFGKQLDNVFGNGKELHAYDVTDKPETYSSSKDIKAENIYFIRVSPVNAAVDAANLKLVNSLGEDLSKFVDIKAEAYNELITTRAAQTGLWKVTVTLKDDVDRAELQKATSAKLSRDQKRTLSSAAYAIAIGNTEDADATRYAVTSYDLEVLTNEYTPTTDLQFTVNGEDIDNIYNRWNYAGLYVEAEDESKERDSLNWELAWNTPAMAKKYEFDIPDVKTKYIKYDATAKKHIWNAVPDAADDRRGEAKLQVQPEEQIVIKFDILQYPYVDRYYVQFDKDNAIESAPSEFESWLSYNATGLFTMKKVSERLILTVPADAAEGDIIGFRLYAVNYDGTLVDPDGKAFYVQVGFVPNAKESDILTGTFTARQAGLAIAGAAGAKAAIQNKANAVIIPFDMAAKYPTLYKGTAITAAVDNGAGSSAWVNIDEDVEQNVRGAAADTGVDIIYLKSDKLDADGNAQLATNVGEVKFIALNVQDPQNIVDDATVETDPLKIFDQDKHDKVIGYLSFMLTKGEIAQVTTTGMENKIQWKSGQNGTFYPKFDGTTWNTSFTTPTAIDLSKYATGLDSYPAASYDWDFKVKDFTANQITAYNAVFGVDPVKASFANPTITVPTAMVNLDQQATLTIKSKTAIKSLSRVATVDEIEDATYDTQLGDDITPTLQTLTFSFKDIAEYQDYKWHPSYQDGAIGATTTTEKEATLYARYGASTVITGIVLANAWTDAVVTSGKVSAVAKKTYTSATALDMGDIFRESSNSVYEPFWNNNRGVYDPAHYWKVAVGNINSNIKNVQLIYVKSANGAINEYLKPEFAGTVYEYNAPAALAKPATTDQITFAKVSAATPLTTTIQQTLVISLLDAFGRVKTFEIPFELVP